MIEISFGKLLVLALIALIVLGPEKLPAAARTAGALLRRVRGGWDSVRAEVERELQVDEIRRTAREAVARMDAAQADLDATVQEVRAVAQTAATLVSAPKPEVDQEKLASAQDGHSMIAPGVEEAVTPADSVEPDTLTGDLFAGGSTDPTAANPALRPSPERPHGAD